MSRLGRALVYAVAAPFGALLFISCLVALLLGATAGLLWGCFGAGLDCRRGRR